VQSSNGVVTLSGYVNSDQERNAAANDASQVAGVKTVVNNLQVATPETAQASQQQTSEPQASTPRRSAPAARPRAERKTSAGRTHDYPEDTTSRVASNAPSGYGSSASVTAPAPRAVTVPEGTTISVRLVDPIDSERNHTGETFRATLDSPIVVGEGVAVPSDADVEGRLVDVKSAGHFAGQSVVALELTQVSFGGKSYDLHTNQFSKQGTSRGKRTAATVGGGAALGALIGGLAGGGKGAAIGAGVGAGAGTGVQGATKGQQIRLPSETVLNFRLEAPLTVTPSASRNAGRPRVD
jgi:hypothetical protein